MNQLGQAVRLDFRRIKESCPAETVAFLEPLKGISGILVKREWRRDWKAIMCQVDFGDDGVFNGPEFMLESAYSDA